jgi:eukaryotic-like serine/threonine-protein kinase
MSPHDENRARERGVDGRVTGQDDSVVTSSADRDAPSVENSPEATIASSGRRARVQDPTLIVAGAKPLSASSIAEEPVVEPESRRRRYRLPTVEREHYQILGEVAVGGIGRIRKAREDRLGRPVALKELRGEADARVEARFVREALITARLQHPSIIPIYEAGRWPSGELFYAMKLVAGRSLAEAIEGRSYEERLELLPHVLDVAEAIAYAHSRRILHRDLKPSNILVGEFGETVVIDWGLAKDLSSHRITPGPGQMPARAAFDSNSAEVADDELLTMMGAVMGTPAYMPPEQASGKPVDERADVYAIGAILYHLLTGHPPYEGSNPMEIVRRVLAGPPAPLQKQQPGIAPDLSAILEKSMARVHHARYPSARELAEDLRRFLNGQIVGAHRYSPNDLLRRFAGRHRAALVVGLASIALMAVLGVVGLRRLVAEWRRAETKQGEVEEARRTAVEHADDLTLMHARAAVEHDPNQALAWLKSISPAFSRWSAARIVAADAKAHGIAMVLPGHTGAVNDVAFSRDGATLATGSDDHTVRLWDVKTGRERILKGHTDEVYFVAFSPDGTQLASAGKDETIRLWDIATGSARVLIGQTGRFGGLAFSPDGRHLLSASYDGMVRLWDAKSGDGSLLSSTPGPIRGMAFSPDGKTVAHGGGDRLLHLTDLESGRVRVLAGHEAAIIALAFSPDGARVATRDIDGTVLEWDARTGAHRALLGSSLSTKALSMTGLGALYFSPDSATIASVGEDETLRLWDVRTGAARALQGHEGRILAAAFSPDGSSIATGSYDRTVRLWSVATGKSRVLHESEDAVIKVAFSPDGEHLAAGSADATARIFPTSTGADRVLVHRSPVLAADFSRDGKLLGSADSEGILRLWDLASGAPRVLSRHGSGPAFLRFSPDGQRLASSGADGVVRSWDRATDLQKTITTYPRESARALAFSPDGRLLASAGGEGLVRVNDLTSGEERVFQGHDRAVTALLFSPSGAELASASLDGVVRLWQLASGSNRAFRGHEEAVSALAFSADGHKLASGSVDHKLRFWDTATGDSHLVDAGGSGITQIAYSADGMTAITVSKVESSLRLWDVATGQQRGALRGHGGEVVGFSLSPDRRLLATASTDRTVRLWDLASGESRVLRGHEGAVLGVVFSPDGLRLASFSQDGMARIWSDDLPHEPAELRAWLAERAP